MVPGKMDVVKNPSSFRNSCSLREGRVAIVRWLQVTGTPIVAGSRIQSAMTEWTASPWWFGYWGLLNNQWDKSFTLLDCEALTLPLPPLPWLLDLAIHFQQEYCCWLRTVRKKVKLAPTISLLTMTHVGCYKPRSLSVAWHPSPLGSLWELWSPESLPWPFFQPCSSPSSFQALFFFFRDLFLFKNPSYWHQLFFPALQALSFLDLNCLHAEVCDQTPNPCFRLMFLLIEELRTRHLFSPAVTTVYKQLTLVAASK